MSLRKKPQNYHRVSFSHQVLVQLTLHVNDYTDEEYEKAWYAPEELDAIMADILDTVGVMEEQQQKSPFPRTDSFFIDEENHSTRGLENFTTEEQQEREQNRQQAINAVLGVQYLQNQEWSAQGCMMAYDDELISQVYSSHTHRSQDLASVLAQSDATVVYSYLKKAKRLDGHADSWSCSFNSLSSLDSMDPKEEQRSRMTRRRSLLGSI